MDILNVQRNEITEHRIYLNLSKKEKDSRNKKLLRRIARDELKHYNFWKKITKKEIAPSCFRVMWYLFLATVLGLSFTLKFMEIGEDIAIKKYKGLRKEFRIAQFIKDEQRHEKELLNLIKEEKVEYASSIVLGLNDALVELTGALAGLTFALQNGRIIAITGFIIGIAASLSMAASGYLSSKEEESKEKNPTKSALYTGITYGVTVLLLILPYTLIHNVYLALTSTLIIAIFIIAAYTFYISTAKNLKFKKRFFEMSLISLTVALITFIIAYIMRTTFGIEV